MYYYRAQYDNSSIDIGDIVMLINEKTKERCEYKIIQSHYEYKPVGISRDSYDFGAVIYNKIPLNKANVEEGEILSDCLVAKSLIGKRVGNVIELPDGDFLINRIRKHKMYVE